MLASASSAKPEHIALSRQTWPTGHTHWPRFQSTTAPPSLLSFSWGSPFCCWLGCWVAGAAVKAGSAAACAGRACTLYPPGRLPPVSQALSHTTGAARCTLKRALQRTLIQGARTLCSERAGKSPAYSRVRAGCKDGQWASNTLQLPASVK